jgi:hypothetical protein
MTRGLSSAGRALPLQGRGQGFEPPRLHKNLCQRLRARLRVHARWARRRLRTVHRAPNDTERDCAARHDRQRGSRNHPGARTATLLLPRLLQGLRQVRDHFLRGRQLLGDRFLRSSDFPGQPALLVPASDLRGGRLRPVNAKANNAACDIHRPHRRVRQASAQPLSWGQLGRRYCAHLRPLCAVARMLHQPAIIATSAGQLRVCSRVFG